MREALMGERSSLTLPAWLRILDENPKPANISRVPGDGTVFTESVSMLPKKIVVIPAGVPFCRV